MSVPWELTVWLVCQSGRPFDYRFSRAAAFQRAKELREGAPSGDWGVEERRAHLVVHGQEALAACPECGLTLSHARGSKQEGVDAARDGTNPGIGICTPSQATQKGERCALCNSAAGHEKSCPLHASNYWGTPPSPTQEDET